MNSRLDVFSASLGPFYRTVELESEVTEQPFLGVDVEVAAEASAHFRRDHSHLLLRQLEHVRKMALEDVWDLGRRPYRKLLVRGEIVGQNPARFEGDGREGRMHRA